MTYFVGLDIAKYKHDCYVMNEKKETIIDSFSLNNNQSGFNTLLNVLNNTLDPNQEKRIGLEATGHYGNNLKIFLEGIIIPSWKSIPFLLLGLIRLAPLEEPRQIRLMLE